MPVCLQPDPQHRHTCDQTGPRQVQPRPGAGACGNIQQAFGLHGDRIIGHQGIYK